jgi:molybdopterin converting factor small subunit
MKVRLQFFSRLRDVVGQSELNLQIPEGTTAGALLEKLYAQFPALRDWDKSLLIGSGLEFVGRDHVLKADEEISIMPPVQGG